jgi:hypothetical protein
VVTSSIIMPIGGARAMKVMDLILWTALSAATVCSVLGFGEPATCDASAHWVWADLSEGGC